MCASSDLELGKKVGKISFLDIHPHTLMASGLET